METARPASGTAALEARHLTFAFPGTAPGARPTVADVNLVLRRGETVALVGESGSGKSTVGRLVVGLLDPDSGELQLDGTVRGRSLTAWRRRVQLVFQDPFASLNPVHPVRHHLARPLIRNGRATQAAEVERRSLELLDLVGLRPAEEFLDAHPQELSGGQRQRVAIARALAPEPDVLVADEPTSMLDVSLRAGVLQLLHGLVREKGLALLLVTHDLASARLLADRTLVLYAGELVEEGPTEELLHDPKHPYTQLLLASVPDGAVTDADVATVAPARAGGPVPRDGCAFASRCPSVQDRCRSGPVSLRVIGAGRSARCHFVQVPNDGAGAPTPP